MREAWAPQPPQARVRVREVSEQTVPELQNPKEQEVWVRLVLQAQKELEASVRQQELPVPMEPEAWVPQPPQAQARVREVSEQTAPELQNPKEQEVWVRSVLQAQKELEAWAPQPPEEGP
jgi:hypothetical protein